MKFRTIGERITYARELKGLKKNQLAREVKVSPAAVTQWEQGDTKGLKPANLVAVAHALGVLTDWLAAEVGPMNPIITSVLLSSAAFVSFSSLLPESLQSSKEAIFSVVALVVTTLNAAVLALGMFNKFTTHSELKKQWIIFLAHLDRADESHLGDIEQELHDLNAREPAASPKLLHKAHEKTKAALGWVNPSCAHQ